MRYFPLLGASLIVAIVSVSCVTPECANRVGGAIVTLHFENTSVHVWMTNDEFIDQALLLEASGEAMIPNFAQVLPGMDCDTRWSWHVDPSDAEWAEVTIEVCDASPWFIEDNRDDWILSPGRWCPWSVVAVEVEDRRGMGEMMAAR